MPKRHNKIWPPEEKEAMIREVRDGSTLKEVGLRREITPQRVGQLIPKVSELRAHVVKNARLRVKELAEAEVSDQEIAQQTGLALSTVKSYRQRAGIKRPWVSSTKRWTPESIIEYAQWWYQQFGLLSAADWFPEMAKKYGHTDRVIRYRLLRPPHCNCVRYYFGTWSEMKRQAGIPESPRGGPSHLNRKRTQPAE